MKLFRLAAPAFVAATLLASTAYAGNVAFCDTATNPILGRVLAYATSVNITPDLAARHGIDVVINPDISALSGVPVHYWRCNATPAVVEMTAPQKATLDAFFVQQGLDADEVAADLAIDSQLELKAAFLTLLDLINVCRVTPLGVFPAVTPAQARDAYLVKVEELLEP